MDDIVECKYGEICESDFYQLIEFWRHDTNVGKREIWYCFDIRRGVAENISLDPTEDMVVG